MMTCLVMVLGSIALTRIPVDLMPDITEPRITITTVYEYASPEEVEELITRPIEEAVSSVTGVEELYSISAEGRSRVTVAFSWGTDIDSVSNDVRDRLDRIYSSLPEKAERPSLRKYNPSEFPVLILGTSSNIDPLKLRYTIDELVQPRIERAPGIAAVDVVGGKEREIHVDLDSEKVKALKLSVNTIVESIEKGNLNLPAGSIYRGRLDVRIRTPGLYMNLDEIRNTIVAMVDGTPVRVRNIGLVEDSWKEETNHVLVNGKNGLILRVNKQSGANTVEVVKGVMKEVARINQEIPEIEIVPIINTAKYIKQSIQNLGQTTMYGGCFAVFVLLFFLRNIRSTFVVAVSIPISVIAAFLLIYFGGFTLNIMTLGGLALGIGMLVDNSIYPVIEQNTPEIESSLAFIGGRPWRPGSANTGEFRFNLKPLAQRTRSDAQIADDLARRLVDVPGVKIRTRKGSGFFLLRRATGSTERLSVEVRGHDLETAAALTSQVTEVIEAVPGVTDTRVSQSLGTPEERIIVDRAKAEEMKLTVTQISETLETALSGRSAGEYRQSGDEFRILVKVRDARRLSLRDILDLTVTNKDGEPIVLRNVVNIQPQTGPTTIECKNQQRYVEISVNIRGRDMGSVAADIEKELKSVAIPSNFQVVVTGDYEEQGKAFRELMLSFALAVLLVYMVMACQFESLRDPFVVMFSVPFAAVGVILILFLTGTTLNLQSFIGCITLAGIVVNNAILLVDHTNLLRRRDGMPLKQAIEEAGRRRLRPILMTAFTTSLALIPLALGLGEGGEAQAPMARAVIGGLLSSMLITLILVPVVYSVLEWKNCRTDKDLQTDHNAIEPVRNIT